MIDNQYHLVVFEGQTTAPKRHLLGNNGLVEVNQPLNLVESFERLVIMFEFKKKSLIFNLM